MQNRPRRSVMANTVGSPRVKVLGGVHNGKGYYGLPQGRTVGTVVTSAVCPILVVSDLLWS